MSDDLASRQPQRQWPPEWVDEAARRGIDPANFAGTPGGSAYAEVWRAFPDATAFEHSWAIWRTPGLEILPLGMDAVPRVTALREARGQRQDLSDATWEQLVTDAAPRLSGEARVDSKAILGAVDRLIAATAEIVSRHRDGEVRERTARGLTESVIRRTADDVRRSRDGHPTQLAVARDLNTSESTLKRAMRDLGMLGWPPPPSATEAD